MPSIQTPQAAVVLSIAIPSARSMGRGTEARFAPKMPQELLALAWGQAAVGV